MGLPWWDQSRFTGPVEAILEQSDWGWEAKPVGTNKPGCRVLLGVAVMRPAGGKGVIRYAVAGTSCELNHRFSSS